GIDVDHVHLLTVVREIQTQHDIRVGGSQLSQQRGKNIIGPKQDVGESECHGLVSDEGKGSVDGIGRSERAIDDDVRHVDTNSSTVAEMSRNVPFSVAHDDEHVGRPGAPEFFEQVLTRNLRLKISRLTVSTEPDWVNFLAAG